MARIELSDDLLTVHVEGFDKVLALKSRVEVPLEHVLSADADPELARRVPRMFRMPGTYFPGVVTAGSFYMPARSEESGWSFWDVHDFARAVVIHLADEHYKWLVVGVDDPQATVDSIRQALARLRR